ncbi:MAG: tetratricopeptide repeat protein [Nitrospira sp. LK70]|nr:tetratricopeptide repeat protein [Nitrospira sp. LK70]
MTSGSKKTDNAAVIDQLALALAKEPKSKAFIPLAEEYGKAGMWEEAVAVLEDGLKTYPNFITAMVALGRAYEQMNQPVKAKAILEEATRLSPDNLRAHRTLAKLYAAQGAKEAAVRSCDVILSMNPYDQEALSLRAGFDVPTVHGAAQSQRQLHARQVKPVSFETDRLRGGSLACALGDAISATKAEANEVPSSAPRLEERLVQTADFTDQALNKTKSAVIAQLEQWLNSVQTRRRNPQVSSRLDS